MLVAIGAAGIARRSAAKVVASLIQCAKVSGMAITEEGSLRVGLRFGPDTQAKLAVVQEMMGAFENPGQVCRYLINRGLEGMAPQIATYETQKRVREVVEKQGLDGQKLFDFMRETLERDRSE